MLLCLVESPGHSRIIDNAERAWSTLDFLAVEQPGMLSWAWCRKPTEEDRALFGVDEEGRHVARTITLADVEDSLNG